MNKKLIAYYSKELRYLRDMGEEFAEQYPKVASRLRLDASNSPDPYVERLLEGVSFLTARTKLKIDAEYPRFVRRILEVVYPQFLYPVPAATIVKFDTSKHYNVNVVNQLKRGHIFESLPIELPTGTLGCQFSVTQDTELTPIKLESCEYTSALEYLPKVVNNKNINLSVNRSALRLDFSVSASNRCSDLAPKELVLYLGSNLPVSSQLLFLLMTSCNEVVCHSYEDARKWSYIVESSPQHKGFEKEEALVFDLDKSIASLRLLQEYIQLPEKFLFVGQKGVSSALRHAEENNELVKYSPQIEEVSVERGVNKRVVGYKKRWFSVSFLFDKYLPDLPQQVKSSDISINTSPMVNLFKKKSVRFPVDIENNEHHVVLDRVQPLNFEVHSIEKVKGYDRYNNQRMTFTPLYQSTDQGLFPSEQQHNAFFSMRREDRAASSSVNQHGSRTSYVGSEVFISIISQNQSIYDTSIDHLSIEAWCTNRDLPLMLIRSLESDFLIDSALPLSAAHIISAVTKPIEAVNEDQTLWSLMNQLNLSYLSLIEHSDKNATLLLKQLLLALPHDNNRFFKTEIESIKKLDVNPVTRVVRHKGAGSLLRGIAISVCFDESLLSGVHPYLFGSILRQYFKRSVSMNAFIELSVETVQQGKLVHWSDLPGERAAI